jgi:uncharacterized protein (TIGR02246 family)
VSINPTTGERKFVFGMPGLILACCFLILGAACTASIDADHATMAAQLQRIDDERQIRALMVSYGQHLDSLDFESYSNLFAEDGEWSGLLGEFTTVKGPAAIRVAMEKAFAERIYDPDHITNVHVITNVKIDVDGDRASGYSRWTVMSRDDEDRPLVRLTGRYDDVFERVDGQWKFQSRRAQREIP